MGALVRWVQSPTRAAIQIVNRVLKNKPGPLSTKEIYEFALKEKPPHPRSRLWSIPPSLSGVIRQAPPQPPNPEHPIRSVRYLKTVVLESLLSDCKVEKIHTRRIPSDADIKQSFSSMTNSARKTKTASLSAPVDAWLWRLRENLPTTPKAIEDKKVFGAEVEDWSHLNKRRRRTRLSKVARAMLPRRRKSVDTSHEMGRLAG